MYIVDSGKMNKGNKILGLIMFPYSFIQKHFINLYYVQGTRKETKECLKMSRIFQIMSVHTLPSWRWSLSLFRCGLCLPERTVWKRGECREGRVATVEKPDRQDLRQEIKVNINSNKSRDP